MESRNSMGMYGGTRKGTLITTTGIQRGRKKRRRKSKRHGKRRM